MKTLKDVKVGETATVARLHGEGPVMSFFFKKIAIQNIHPILNANILKCFNFKTLKHLNIKMLKLRS